jgi:PAS domain S-box-containing protein
LQYQWNGHCLNGRRVLLSPELAHSVLESAPDAIVLVDADGTVVFANQQVEALFQYAPGAIVGKPVEVLLPERFRARHSGHREQFAKHRRVRPMGAGLDLFGRRSDGTEFPVEISLSPIRDGERMLVAAAIRDVTDRKRIEAELVAAREVAVRARDAADRANQGKSRFLATASHDLRQPLQTLALLHGTLARCTHHADAAEALKGQEQAIGAMSRLLNALLDISKLESGAIHPELSDFPVAPLLEELRSEFNGVATAKGLRIRVDARPDIVINSDRALVEQVLRNLLSNAIKYTSSGSVTLRCRIVGSRAELEVVDTGVGIPADQLPYICDEFYQVGVDAHTVREGYGLGLSIVQRLVKLLDATLHVTSKVGVGSAFAVDLPLGAHQVQRAAPPAASAATGRRPLPQRAIHILIVEDDPAVLAATRMLLKAEGYRVSAAATVADAVRSAREHADIQLLISDYHLARGETGTDAIQAVRGVLGPHVPAVLVTGDTSGVIRELRHDGHVRITSKPIRSAELLSILHSLHGDEAPGATPASGDRE